MNRIGPQPKLIGLAGSTSGAGQEHLRRRICEELSTIRALHESGIIVVVAVKNPADFSFLRICAGLRIPMILFLPQSPGKLIATTSGKDEKAMAEALIGIALAKYRIRGSGEADLLQLRTRQAVIEFADALLMVLDHGHPVCGPSHDLSLVQDAREMGIPTRVINPVTLDSQWSVSPEADRKARHGFETRKELLEFLDARFDPAS